MHTSPRKRLGAILLGASLGMMALPASMPAILAASAAMTEHRFDTQRGGGRRSLSRYGYRAKPWTCTAIEKRKAAKRRHVQRSRARRRA